LQSDDSGANRLRVAARQWVEQEFDAGRNAAIVLESFRAARQ
jgi:hypothetical protein